MSDALPPPPPPSGGTPIPPPPPPSIGTAPPPYQPAPSYAVAPPGIVYATPLGATPTDTGGLRKATTVLLWCAAGSAVLLLVALISRKVTWNHFVDGDASFDDLRGADDFVGAAGGISTLLALAILIVVSIWSLRTARHARATGATNLSPGLACGGWYIPLANFIVPFVQLRRVATHRRRSSAMLNLWQGMLITLWVATLVLRGVGNADEDTADDLSSRLTAEIVVGVVIVALSIIAAIAASRAMRDVDGVGDAAT